MSASATIFTRCEKFDGVQFQQMWTAVCRCRWSDLKRSDPENRDAVPAPLVAAGSVEKLGMSPPKVARSL